MNNLAYCYERGEGVEQNGTQGALTGTGGELGAGSDYCMYCLRWNYSKWRRRGTKYDGKRSVGILLCRRGREC